MLEIQPYKEANKTRNWSVNRNKPYPGRSHAWEGDRLLNADEVAQILDQDPDTIREWFRTGKLPGFKITPDALQWKMFASRLREICEDQEQTFVEKREGGK